MERQDDWERFRARLDEHHDWPTSYVFKFIVPRAQVEAVRRLLAGREFTTRDSEGGRWVSFTARLHVSSADEVIALYREASRIDGLIAL